MCVRVCVHLHVRQLQFLGQLSSLGRGEILLLLKLLLQVCHLLTGEGCAWLLLLPESVFILFTPTGTRGLW